MSLSPQNLGVRFVPVTILQATPGRDSVNQPNQTPQIYKSCSAQVISLRGQELAAAQQINAQISTKITFRYNDVKTVFEDGTLVKMYVQYRQTYYDIQGLVSRDQRDQWIDCFCVARIGEPPVFA